MGLATLILSNAIAYLCSFCFSTFLFQCESEEIFLNEMHTLKQVVEAEIYRDGRVGEWGFEGFWRLERWDVTWYEISF